MVVVEPTRDLLRLQLHRSTRWLRSRWSPVRRTRSSTQSTIRDVGAGASAGAGDDHNPHINVDRATCDDLGAKVAGPFGPFAFAPIDVAARPLANDGTATRKLRERSIHAARVGGQRRPLDVGLGKTVDQSVRMLTTCRSRRAPMSVMGSSCRLRSCGVVGAHARAAREPARPGPWCRDAIEAATLPRR
jgi:hypothetical protein